MIRLRGLFDVLLDKDDESALAGGRAKEEWTRSAMRARYGAGGAYARGSLAKKGSSESSPDIFSSQMSASSRLHSYSSTSPSSENACEVQEEDSSSSMSITPVPSPPRQSYAKELLAQCRECRAELERERARVEARDRKFAERESKGNFGDLEWWNPARYFYSVSSHEIDEAPDSSTNLKGTLINLMSLGSSGEKETKNISTSSSTLSSVKSLFSSEPDTTATSSSALHSDHEGEAGWVGSGVWGLSAVGQRQRQADRERDEKIDKGHIVEDDGGRRQRQIEWEGFLRYAEQKERGKS